jgi:hypothetical protein
VNKTVKCKNKKIGKLGTGNLIIGKWQKSKKKHKKQKK